MPTQPWAEWENELNGAPRLTMWKITLFPKKLEYSFNRLLMSRNMVDFKFHKEMHALGGAKGNILLSFRDVFTWGIFFPFLVGSLFLYLFSVIFKCYLCLCFIGDSDRNKSSRLQTWSHNHGPGSVQGHWECIKIEQWYKYFLKWRDVLGRCAVSQWCSAPSP